MKKNIITVLSVSLFGLVFLGCAGNKPVPKPQPPAKPQKIIYTPSEDVKKAVAILIYKQKELEKRVENLENGVPKQNKNTKKKQTQQAKVCNFSNQKKAVKTVSVDTNAYYVAKTNVNIRRCATVKSPITGIVKKGEKVKFLYCNVYNWCFLKDKRGYVSRVLFDKADSVKPYLNNASNKNVIKTEKHKNKIRINKKPANEKETNNSAININNKTNNKKVLNADEVIKKYINSK
ncbi:SH3 domain-containing protein [Caminibacter sp.]